MFKFRLRRHPREVRLFLIGGGRGYLLAKLFMIGGTLQLRHCHNTGATILVELRIKHNAPHPHPLEHSALYSLVVRLTGYI